MSKVQVISIIDDDESVRIATRRLVRSFGYVGCAFASAEEFLHSPSLNDTACVIADVQMPGMSGVDLKRALKASGNDTPVILITAFPDDNIRRRALSAGAICFLNKPFDGATLMGYLRSALEARHGES